MTEVLVLLAICSFICLFLKESRYFKIIKFAFGVCVISIIVIPFANGNFKLPETFEIEKPIDENYDSVIVEAGKNICVSLEKAIGEIYSLDSKVECSLDVSDRENVKIEEIRVSVPTGNKDKIENTVKELTSCENVIVGYKELE